MADELTAVRAFMKHIEGTLVERLEGTISSLIEKVVKKRFEGLEKKIDSIQRSIDILEGDISEDRKNIGEMTIAQVTIKSEISEMRKLVHKQTKKVGDKVVEEMGRAQDKMTDHVVEVVQPTVQDTLNEFVADKPQIVKKPKKFYQFWKKE